MVVIALLVPVMLLLVTFALDLLENLLFPPRPVPPRELDPLEDDDDGPPPDETMDRPAQ